MDGYALPEKTKVLSLRHRGVTLKNSLQSKFCETERSVTFFFPLHSGQLWGKKKENERKKKKTQQL